LYIIIIIIIFIRIVNWMDKFDKMDFSSIEFLWGENEYDLLSK